MNDAEYERLMPAIQRSTGVDLNFYKPRQMVRRLDGYISRVAGGSTQTFADLIEKDPAAADALKDFLTINVTDFFRDPHSWTDLETKVLPELLARSSALKIWSAGCSQGSEPYTIAMILETLAPNRPHKILATDLDAKVVDRAAAGGPYAKSDLKNLSDAQLRKWFDEEDGGFRINNDIRKRVTFRRHNLLMDRFDSGFDLIVCRNVVIYFSEEAKHDLNERFAAALRPGGYFFIGGTETLLDASTMGFERRSTSLYQRGPDLVVAKAA
ncbi:MAG: protein-glutamate O-methyltransferase CheR [Chloroflexi bacterium]|nr:protein-glutamate O-methyltransferase CheR [Chloroflexota bacterium]